MQRPGRKGGRTPGGNGKDADRDVYLSPDHLWHVTGQDAASKRQDAYKEVTIARLAQDVRPGDVFCSS